MTIAELRRLVNDIGLDNVMEWNVASLEGMPLQLAVVAINGEAKQVKFRVTADPVEVLASRNVDVRADLTGEEQVWLGEILTMRQNAIAKSVLQKLVGRIDRLEQRK